MVRDLGSNIPIALHGVYKFEPKPGEFDPRKYLGAALEALIAMVKYKTEQVLGNAGKA